MKTQRDLVTKIATTRVKVKSLIVNVENASDLDMQDLNADQKDGVILVKMLVMTQNTVVTRTTVMITSKNDNRKIYLPATLAT